jgi:hypothetical protein
MACEVHYVLECIALDMDLIFDTKIKGNGITQAKRWLKAVY